MSVALHAGGSSYAPAMARANSARHLRLSSSALSARPRVTPEVRSNVTLRGSAPEPFRSPCCAPTALSTAAITPIEPPLPPTVATLPAFNRPAGVAKVPSLAFVRPPTSPDLRPAPLQARTPRPQGLVSPHRCPVCSVLPTTYTPPSVWRCGWGGLGGQTYGTDSCSPGAAFCTARPLRYRGTGVL